MRQFGGLRKKMPQTYLTFLIGALTLAGCPFLSAFWSKDTILSAVHESAHVPATEAHLLQGSVAAVSGAADAFIDGALVSRSEPRLLGLARRSLYELLFWMGTFTALLTAFYTFRAFFMTFHGPERIPPEAAHHAHESPRVMCVPLWILAIGALFLGGLLDQHTTGLFNRFLDRAIPGIETAALAHKANVFVMALSGAAALAGFGAACFLYGTGSTLPARLAAIAGPLADLSRNKFYLDEVYAALFVWPVRAMAALSRFLDWGLIDGLLVGGIGKLPALVGRLPRPIQNGLVQFYALAMMLALSVLLWVLLTKQG